MFTGQSAYFQAPPALIGNYTPEYEGIHEPVTPDLNTKRDQK